MGWLTRDQLQEIGFASLGTNVLISERASIHGAQSIEIGNNVRIDDFCVISAGSGGIKIGNFIHIATQATLIGTAPITMQDYSGLSSRVSIYSSNDDYSGAFMTNPTVPSGFTNVTHAEVIIGKHAIVGSGSIILPGVTLEEGVAIGALSLVTKRCKAFGIYVGNPARFIKNRARTLLDHEQRFAASLAGLQLTGLDS